MDVGCDCEEAFYGLQDFRELFVGAGRIAVDTPRGT